MALALGSRLGPYEVIAPLGAGGMGEVYRAHDSKLGLRQYYITPYGRQFVFATPDTNSAPTSIRMVLDWRAQLERLMASK